MDTPTQLDSAGRLCSGKESQKWEEGLQAVNEHLRQVAQSKKVVVVQDREADIFAFFKAHREPGVELVVRLYQNRKFETPETRTIAKLADAVRGLPVLGTQQTQVRRQNRDVNLTLRIQAAPIHVLPGKDLSAQLHKTQGLSLVVATEIAATDENGKDYFDESKSAQWILLTSLKANDLSEAARVVRCYSMRWAVERFHFTCKTGALQVEKFQFDDIHTTLNALAFYSIIAWRILFLTLSVRQNPMQDPEAYFDPIEMKVLCTHDPQARSSLDMAIRTLGKLVNFVPTKKQPYPGIKIMAEALRKLEDIAAFLRILNEKTLQD
ncbi:MAG: IS4 family transposase [Haliscomenobacter sp.]|nr:IS4 family transposase [Haliscomenobacter sp.]